MRQLSRASFILKEYKGEGIQGNIRENDPMAQSYGIHTRQLSRASFMLKEYGKGNTRENDCF